ncbi:antibiotic biosynthesis monooxygenase [Cronobacter dublinensis]|uniref:Antibiotic biosynthesis monooxygenase n=1 Tax=Cronobacter dublinensis TaxID=413497 RepID=A0A9Q4T7C3_9ENTR|nr:antibiotic biosynthesis monooxygenase [Cronobacter dublinensis]EGT4360934.1 antibiotic biosynthesis monooxygenase [Cronobacter dublinensis]EKF2280520.1 antibiotic biosynthesis monooxygenase [Cronobacter dublinensis]EKF2294001.1 antibiotic biosynthesis monooxygenase [Cronobacter dublinensis]EKF2298273.1 antibiotic biosynthesis monooxygenase [Cronobacter dublinensis]EKK5269606.1 antibiotic biosynthesis monooxygenase [Cronobacter dublinensis]
MIAVLFEAQALPQAQQRYFDLAAGLKPLLADAPGFIDLERFQSLAAPDRFLSLSWWESEEAVRQWKGNLMHQAAQQEGKERIFAHYRIRVAQVLRDYSSDTKDNSHV